MRLRVRPEFASILTACFLAVGCTPQPDSSPHVPATTEGSGTSQSANTEGSGTTQPAKADDSNTAPAVKSTEKP